MRAVIIFYALLLAGAGWGAWQLQTEPAYVPGVKLRLVQADIAQHHKWDPKLQTQGLEAHINLTQSPGLENITHVIWPETAVPYAIKAGGKLTKLIGAAIPPQTILITGGLRVDGNEQDWRMFNSIVAIDHEGDIVGGYDKARLVPFGEFLPFRSLLPRAWLTPVGEHDFSSSAGAQTLEWPGLPPLQPLICYEAIFPEFVGGGNTHPDWLLNITNDAWFGMSSGPYQHFHMARMRAVEQGAPLVRVANTGITAIVDSNGRITSQLGLGEKGYLDSRLPVSKPRKTLYFSYGNWLFFGLIFVALVLTIRQRKAENN